jgi:exopolysaccharide biosynthesis polyprenyl glycosylphosphotransferase
MTEGGPKPAGLGRPLLLILDQGMLVLAFTFAMWLSYYSGLSPDKTILPIRINLMVLGVLNIFWLCLFGLFGLYGRWKYTSRFDEIISLYKTITVGGVVFLVIAFSQSPTLTKSKLIALGYWASLVLLTGAGRFAFRSAQRHLLLRGIGLRPSIIVGRRDTVRSMIHRINDAPALGYNIVGVILTEKKHLKRDIAGKTVLGSLTDLHGVIGRHGITDVLIALEFRNEEEIFTIVSSAGSYDVDFSIMPGPADILAGRMMFNHIYGFPMIHILVEPMPPWEKNVKRIMDIFVSICVTVVFFPIVLAIAIAIKLDSPGKVFYKQERLGYREKPFNVWKFRSMRTDAEKVSGPVWAGKDDPRITRIGSILRKLRLDELPQMYNILRGEMSLVGPRPERRFFVEQLTRKIPYYALRLRVKPGLTGWAQIKHNYDRSLDDVREKLKYDLYYIENMSLRMDFKILFATVYVVLTHKGAH